jgi:hypothetical protein
VINTSTSTTTLTVLYNQYFLLKRQNFRLGLTASTLSALAVTAQYALIIALAHRSFPKTVQ